MSADRPRPPASVPAEHRCVVCHRNEFLQNTPTRECSHVECPSRRKAWSERPEPTPQGPWPVNVDADPLPLTDLYPQPRRRTT